MQYFSSTDLATGKLRKDKVQKEDLSHREKLSKENEWVSQSKY